MITRNKSLCLFLTSCSIFFNCEAKSASFREQLAHKLPDIERVDQIVREYNQLSKKVRLKNKTAKVFKKWLCEKSVFIGSNYYNHNLLFKRIKKLKKNRKFTTAYQEFITNLRKNARGWSSNRHSQHKRISILFTGAYGGGHRAPTMAIRNYLESKGHKVQLIDVDEVENRYSPTINGYTKADIYAEIYQKQNDPEKARKLTRQINAAQKIEDKKYLADIRHDILSFEPDHIIAVAHHKPKLAYISYMLGIPMTYVHTDHGFNKILMPLLKEQKRLKTPLVHFAMLDKDPMFKKKPLKKQLERLDFPVRKSFAPATKNEKNAIRDKLQVPHNAHVVKLAMGQNGLSDDIKSILNRIQREEKKLKKELHVFVVCGKNAQLKADLDAFPAKGKVHVHTLGFLEEKEMAEIDKASDVWITKPGGSTSAELVQTQKQMLFEINEAHPWEQKNAKFLQKLGLAKKLAKKGSIVTQIQKSIQRHKKLNLQKLPLSLWQLQLDEIIRR